MTYNSTGLPDTITETPPSGSGLTRVTTMTYDASSQAQTITTPDNIVLTLNYDPRGRVISVTDNLNQIIEYQYDAAGNRTRINTREGDDTLTSTLAQNFDALNRRIATIQPHINGLDSIPQLGYDRDGNLDSQRIKGVASTKASIVIWFLKVNHNAGRNPPMVFICSAKILI